MCCSSSPCMAAASDRPAMDAKQKQAEMCSGGSAQRRSNKAHPIFPESYWILAGSNRHRLVHAALRSSPEAGEAAPRDDGSARGREVAPFASLESELNISWSSVTDRTVLGCPGVYRPPRTVIGISSTPQVVVFGRKAARRRAESPLARPGRGEFSGVNSSSAGEAPAAACVGTNHRSACPVLCAQWRRQVAGVASHGMPRPSPTWRRGGCISRGSAKFGRAGGRGGAAFWCQVSWEEGCPGVCGCGGLSPPGVSSC